MRLENLLYRFEDYRFGLDETGGWPSLAMPAPPIHQFREVMDDQLPPSTCSSAIWFFTVNLADRRSRLLVERIDALREALRYVHTRHPCRIEAMMVLPDHLHAVWTLPPGDAAYPMRWRLLKSWFSRHIPTDERRRDSRVDKGERGIWQRRYWEHQVRDEQDLERCVDYVYFNPVKHGHAPRAVDWPYSTFHRYLKKGWLPADWGAALEAAGDFGERGGPLQVSQDLQDGSSAATPIKRDA